MPPVWSLLPHCPYFCSQSYDCFLPAPLSLCIHKQPSIPYVSPTAFTALRVSVSSSKQSWTPQKRLQFHSTKWKPSEMLRGIQACRFKAIATLIRLLWAEEKKKTDHAHYLVLISRWEESVGKSTCFITVLNSYFSDLTLRKPCFKEVNSAKHFVLLPLQKLFSNQPFHLQKKIPPPKSSYLLPMEVVTHRSVASA